MRTPRYSIKQTDSLVPLVPVLYKIHWIMRRLACLSCRLSTTADQFNNNSTGMYSTGLWSCSLSCKRTARESSRLCLRSAQQHRYALPYLPEIHWSLRNTDGLYNPDTLWWSHDVRNRGVAL